MNNSGNDIKALDASVTIDSALVWLEFAAAGHACVKHKLPSIGALGLFPNFVWQNTERTYFNVIRMTTRGAPNIFQDLLF